MIDSAVKITRSMTTGLPKAALITTLLHMAMFVGLRVAVRQDLPCVRCGRGLNEAHMPLQTWDIRYSDAAATRLPYGRARIGHAERASLHATPDVLGAEVR